MRGKASAASIRNFAMGITPAYAGKNKGSGYQQERGQDHPRLCGEKMCLSCMITEQSGSPPPMRGKVLRRGSKKRSRKDHPRLCGEKGSQTAQNAPYQGSPPPMRGKELHLLLWLVWLWITPAYAGKRDSGKQQVGRKRDHPRLCGEKDTEGIFSHPFSGSPPPMRGKACR